MSEKRKDHKGRLLRTGESQRKDLTYQFCYTDVTGKRRTFYAKDLKELRKQGEKIQREAPTPEEQEIFMTFVKEDSHYRCYYDEFNVLLGTGMRVSEFCGLTLSDLDFENRKIRVEKQLIKEKGGIYHVEETKTESGVRFIPMSDEVYQSLKNLVAKRKKPQDAGITMNVYTHASFAQAEKSMQKILRFELHREAKTG